MGYYDDDDRFSVSKISFKRAPSAHDQYAVEESISESISQMPMKVDVEGADQGWSEDGKSYSFATYDDDRPTSAEVDSALNHGEYAGSRPEVDSVETVVESAPGSDAMMGAKKGGNPSASLGGLAGSGAKGGAKAPTAKCNQPVGYNGQPCILTPGHGGNHRSR